MDEVTIKLPVSGKEVVIRNYTNRKDDARAEAVLYSGVAAEQEAGTEQKISFPLYNVMASQKSYIYRLVNSIDGNSKNLTDQIDDLRSEDFAVLEEAVTKVVDNHSPKAAEVKSTSTSSTPEK